MHRGRVLLARRPSNGLLGGMWEFPNGRVNGSPARFLGKTIRDAYQLDVRCEEPLGIVEHAYSHFSVSVHAFRCEVKDVPKKRDLRWVPLRALEDFPMGRIDRQIARKLV